jgi:hypothetical protein
MDAGWLDGRVRIGLYLLFDEIPESKKGHIPFGTGIDRGKITTSGHLFQGFS